MKQLVFDLASTILLLAIVLITNNLYLATGVAMAVGLAQIVWQKAHRQPIQGLQWLSLFLAAMLGTLSVLIQDARILVLKPSLFEAAVGIYMLRRPDFLFAYVPAKTRDTVPRRVMVVWGYVYALAFLVLAVSSLLVAYLGGLRVWAVYKLAAPCAVMTLLYLAVRVRRALARERPSGGDHSSCCQRNPAEAVTLPRTSSGMAENAP